MKTEMERERNKERSVLWAPTHIRDKGGCAWCRITFLMLLELRNNSR